MLNESALDYEIIVINDGSIDKTLQVIQEEQRLDTRVTICKSITRATICKSNGTMSKLKCIVEGLATLS